jgi:hypothetical protein
MAGEKNKVVIDGVEHDMSEWSDKQKILLEHVADLDRKINSARFNLDQLTVGRDSFFAMLKESLEPKAGLND